jgi:hypothetical protein
MVGLVPVEKRYFFILLKRILYLVVNDHCTCIMFSDLSTLRDASSLSLIYYTNSQSKRRALSKLRFSSGSLRNRALKCKMAKNMEARRFHTLAAEPQVLHSTYSASLSQNGEQRLPSAQRSERRISQSNYSNWWQNLWFCTRIFFNLTNLQNTTWHYMMLETLPLPSPISSRVRNFSFPTV